MDKPIQPQAPYKWEYEEQVDRKYIYSFKEMLRDNDGDWDGEEDTKDKGELPTKPVGEINLEWLVSQVPPGVSLSQIKMEFGFYASDMAYEDHWIQFYYEVTIPARKAEYKAAEKAYNKAMKQYEKDMVAYEANALSADKGEMTMSKRMVPLVEKQDSILRNAARILCDLFMEDELVFFLDRIDNDSRFGENFEKEIKRIKGVKWFNRYLKEFYSHD